VPASELQEVMRRIKQLEVALGPLTFESALGTYGINQFKNLAAPLGGHYLMVINNPRPTTQ
jgi:hypothetical protein